MFNRRKQQTLVAEKGLPQSTRRTVVHPMESPQRKYPPFRRAEARNVDGPIIVQVYWTWKEGETGRTAVFHGGKWRWASNGQKITHPKDIETLDDAVAKRGIYLECMDFTLN